MKKYYLIFIIMLFVSSKIAANSPFVLDTKYTYQDAYESFNFDIESFDKVKKIKIGRYFTKYQNIPNIVYYGDKLYTFNTDNQIVIYGQKGKIEKKVKIPKKYNGTYISSIAMLPSGSLIVAISSGGILRYSPDLETISWEAQVGNSLIGSLVLDENKIFVVTATQVISLDQLTGRIIWNSAIDNNGVTIKDFRAPVVEDNYLILGTPSSEVLLYQKSSGVLQPWKISLFGDNLFNVSSNPVVGDISAPPLVQGQNIIVTANNKVASYSIYGDQNWENENFGSYFAPAIYKGIAYFSSLNGTLVAVNASTGSILWNATIPHSKRAKKGLLSWSRPYIVNETTVMVTSNVGEVVFLSTKDGSLISKYKLYSSELEFISGYPLIVDNAIYFVSSRGVVYKINTQTG